MPDRYRPFTNSAALTDAPVSPRGSLVLLFTYPWENDLGRSEGQPPADPQPAATAEATATASATGEEEVIAGR